MFKKIFKHVRMFVLLSFLTLTTFTQVQKAYAVVGLATGFVPVMIVGFAGLNLGPSVVTSAWLTGDPKDPNEPIPSWVSVVFLATSIVSFIILDEENSTAHLQQISLQKAEEYGLNAQEHVAYNKAIKNGEMDAVLQTAAQEYAELKEKSLSSAGAIMNNLTSVLDTNARNALHKISTHIVLKIAQNQ